MISGPTADRQRGIVPVLGVTHVAGRSARADEVGLRAGQYQLHARQITPNAIVMSAGLPVTRPRSAPRS
jgi:hypothetical protein